MSRFSLESEVALVTGGATGIGRAIAGALAQAGADVAFTVHSSSASETRALVEGAGRKALSLQYDLSDIDPAGAGRLLDEVEGGIGSVSILVNNAGMIRRSPAAEHRYEDWRALMQVNLDAVWLLSREAGRRMLSRGHGKIISIASLLSFQGGINVPGYTASKHAVTGLTKALANEWAAGGVNVNAIAPGYIVTANTAALRADENRSRQILERIPAGRWGDPEDIAGAAVFLACGEAAYINGQVLAVDGGWLAR